MESIHNVLMLLGLMYLRLVDLKDAFFSVPIFKEHQKSEIFKILFRL